MATQHAHLGGSSATRWINCSASAILTRGIPNKAGAAADEGTAAHELAEWCLKNDKAPGDRLGEKIKVGSGEIEVTEDMVLGVESYVRVCRILMMAADWHDIELRITLDPYWKSLGMEPPEPMFGTTDFGAYVVDLQRLYVVDLKFGAGVLVPAADNDQALYYALGTYFKLKDRFEIKEIEICIAQPRLRDSDGETVRSWRIPVIDLMLWAQSQLKPAVEKIRDEWVEYSVGKWCKFCARKADCRALAAKSLDEARVVFANNPVDLDLEEGGPMPEMKHMVGPPAPERLSGEDLARVLEMAPVIKDWLNAVEEEALARRVSADNMMAEGMDAGQADPPPGFKVASKYGHRKWLDETDTARQMEAEGLAEDQVFETKVRSPAQLEKKLKLIGVARDRVAKVIGALAEKPVTGIRLVKDDTDATVAASLTDTR